MVTFVAVLLLLHLRNNSFLHFSSSCFYFHYNSFQLPLFSFSIKPLHDLSMSASIQKSIHSTLFLPVALYFSVVLFFSVWHFDFHSFIDPPPISILLHTEQTHTHTHSGAILSTSNGSHIFHIRSQWWCTTPASPLCIKCKESATSISSWNNISHSHLIWSRTYAGDESAFTLLIGFCVNSNVECAAFDL